MADDIIQRVECYRFARGNVLVERRRPKRAPSVRFAPLDVEVITASSLRLDLDADRNRLDETVAALKPRLFILDPFVRLHRIDKNASGEVAPVLARSRSPVNTRRRRPLCSGATRLLAPRPTGTG
jgi:hypothetical protein